MLAFVFYCFLAYLLYRFLFGFVIPVVRTTRQVRRSFREMKNHMSQFQEQPEPPKSRSTVKENIASKEDYIDFEEIK